MKVDASIRTSPPTVAAEEAQRIEAEGYDGAFTLEGSHDPFLPLVAAAEATKSVQLYTAVAIAFARNPMILANIGYDLQLFSEGRFMLGLGSQIRTHIEKRFNMPWSEPARRMREFVLAIRAIWASWETGERLNYRGDIYQNTLMTPFANPGPNPFGTPPIILAGVGPRMTEVAAEVGDGFILHPFNSIRSVRELTFPALQRGAAKAGKTLEGYEVAAQVLVALGANAEEVARAKRTIKDRIAFYGSTPAYRPVLDLEGRGDLQEELNAMTKRGEWAEMGSRVPDDVAESIAVIGTPDEVAAQLKERYDGFATRICPSFAIEPSPGAIDAMVRGLR